MTQGAVAAQAIHGRREEARASSKVVVIDATGLTTPPSPARATGNADAQPLPRDDFLHDMKREKRRAERTCTPLTLVVFEFRAGQARNPRHTSQLTDLLHMNTRETDTMGHVGEQAIAVLCPNTDLAGAHKLITKIDSLAGHLPYKATAATYPDAVFDQLASGCPSGQFLRSLVVADDGKEATDAYLLKRCVDIVGALVALVVLSPVIVLAMLAIVLTSHGSVVFTQVRIGKGGLPFKFYKLRSMVAANDDRSHRAFVADLIRGESNHVKSNPEAPIHYKMARDDRVTAVGRFIRKTSIDELPQLVNVLKGDMSLVGPRPPLTYETAHYQAWHLRRILAIKPGITGLWQVDGRSRVSFNEMVRLDLRYIRDCSLWLDLKILWRTVAVVLLCKGAV